MEMALMLEKLQSDPTKIPSPSRDEMMAILVSALENVPVDSKKGFKNLFVTNALGKKYDIKDFDQIKYYHNCVILQKFCYKIMIL